MISDDRLRDIANDLFSDCQRREMMEMAKELLALRKAFGEPVAFYADGAYYNTAKAALKDGAEEITPLFTAPSSTQ